VKKNLSYSKKLNELLCKAEQGIINIIDKISKNKKRK